MGALNGGQNIVNLSAARWDDFLVFLALCVGGCCAIWQGDKTAGSPIKLRMLKSDAGGRTGCVVFGIGIGVLALLLFMASSVLESDHPFISGAIFLLWLAPAALVVRGSWRRFSGRGWLYGEKPWF
jgi:hypothetical protein